MIPWLARRAWGRILLLPAVVAACAFSWGSYVAGGLPKDKRVYWADAWGWLSPEMTPHWRMLAETTHPARKSTFHELKNIGAEYCRAWPQTAAKAGSFLACAAIGLLMLMVALRWVL